MYAVPAADDDDEDTTTARGRECISLWRVLSSILYTLPIYAMLCYTLSSPSSSLHPLTNPPLFTPRPLFLVLYLAVIQSEKGKAELSLLTPQGKDN